MLVGLRPFLERVLLELLIGPTKSPISFPVICAPHGNSRFL